MLMVSGCYLMPRNTAVDFGSRVACFTAMLSRTISAVMRRMGVVVWRCVRRSSPVAAPHLYYGCCCCGCCWDNQPWTARKYSRVTATTPPPSCRFRRRRCFCRGAGRDRTGIISRDSATMAAAVALSRCMLGAPTSPSSFSTSSSSCIAPLSVSFKYNTLGMLSKATVDKLGNQMLCSALFRGRWDD